MRARYQYFKQQLKQINVRTGDGCKSVDYRAQFKRWNVKTDREYFGSPQVCAEAFDKAHRMESCFVSLNNDIGGGEKNCEQIMFDYARFIRNVVIYTLNLAQFASLSLFCIWFLPFPLFVSLCPVNYSRSLSLRFIL